jgi:hypothetical protein
MIIDNKILQKANITFYKNSIEIDSEDFFKYCHVNHLVDYPENKDKIIHHQLLLKNMMYEIILSDAHMNQNEDNSYNFIIIFKIIKETILN